MAGQHELTVVLEIGMRPYGASASSRPAGPAYVRAMAHGERRPDIDPSPEALERYLAEDDGRPVTMLNLHRFKRDDGKARFEQFVMRFTPVLESIGGEVVYLGQMSSPFIPTEGSGWEAIFLTRYPRRELLLKLVEHPEYPALRRLRSEALETTVFETTVSW